MEVGPGVSVFVCVGGGAQGHLLATALLMAAPPRPPPLPPIRVPLQRAHILSTMTRNGTMRQQLYT